MNFKDAYEKMRDWFNGNTKGVVDGVAFSMALNALKKRIPVKPIYGYDEQDYITCPDCNYPLDTMDAGEYASNYKFCPECGRAIDWTIDWRK